MQFKASYMGSVKALPSEQISSYDELKESMASAFDLAGLFKIYYIDEDNTEIIMENDNDFQILVEDSMAKEVTFFVKESRKSRKINKTSVRAKTINCNPKPVSEEIQDKADNLMSAKKSHFRTIFTEIPSWQEPEVSKQESKTQKMQASELSKDVEFFHDVNCSRCQCPIIGFPFKCLKCFDHDICSRCFKNHFQNEPIDEHNFVEIVDDTFQKRVNYRTVIRQLFQPNYIEEYDCKGEEWITLEDVEKGSEVFKDQINMQIEKISNFISRNYDKWMKQYEEEQIR